MLSKKNELQLFLRSGKKLNDTDLIENLKV